MKMQKPLPKVLASFMILFVGGAIFFFFPNWLILPLTALVWLVFEIRQSSKENDLKRKLILAAIMGLSLTFFDFAAENLGAQLGYWSTLKSAFFVIAVPIEIILTCLWGGAAFFLFLSHIHWTLKKILLSALLWSVGGTAGELYLTMIGFMKYGNGWSSIPHAFVSYVATWFLLHAFYQYLNGPFSPKHFGRS